MPYIINNQSLTIIANNTVATCSLEQCPFKEEVLAALRRRDEQTAIAIINKDRQISDWINDENTMIVKNRSVMFRESELDQWREVHNVLVDRIVDMQRQGFDPAPMVKFLFNLNQNPSESSKQDLYGFLETNRLPVTIDGHFLAYKKVRGDYMDCYTGTLDNSPGKTVTLSRDLVDPNRDNTCSTGLHVCSGGYLNHFWGDKIMLIKVHPKDVVTVPTDYKNSKMRCCKYYVVRELGEEDIEKVAVYVD